MFDNNEKVEKTEEKFEYILREIIVSNNSDILCYTLDEQANFDYEGSDEWTGSFKSMIEFLKTKKYKVIQVIYS